MRAIEIMVEEHKHIKRVLTVIRKLSLKLYHHQEVDYNLFMKIVDFVRNYADKHHHSKEEDILFVKMSAELDEEVAKGTIPGMLSEHDLGRLFIYNLINAVERVQKGETDANVDVIANAIGYADLLTRHIDKEDKAIYVYGEKNLSKSALEEIEIKSFEVEQEAERMGIQKKYLQLVDELERAVM